MYDDLDNEELTQLLNTTNKDDLIDGFKVKNGVITIKYKNLKKFRTLYTEELKEQLLSKMERNSNDFEESLNFFESVTFDIAVGALLLTIFRLVTVGSLFYLIPLIGASSCISYCLFKIIKTALKNTKKMKQQFYIDYKDKLLDKTLSDNSSMMLNLDKNTIHKLYKIESRDDSLDINNISEFSVSQLRKIKTCLLANEQFGIKSEYIGSDMDNLVKKYDNINDEELYSDNFKTLVSTELVDNAEKKEILLKEKEKLKQKKKNK